LLKVEYLVIGEVESVLGGFWLLVLVHCERELILF